MDINALSGIRTHDPSVRAGEDSSCLRMRGHCDQQKLYEYKETNAGALVRQRTIPTERPPLVGEVSANF
jgi:hypothetical protein